MPYQRLACRARAIVGTFLAWVVLGLGVLDLAGAEPTPVSPTLSVVHGVESQPLVAQIRRLIEATDFLGSPFSPADRQALEQAFALTEPEQLSEAIQRIIDPYCLVLIDINPEMRLEARRGPAQGELLQQGWRQFLVKVHNAAGLAAPLRGVSPQGQAVFSGGKYQNESDREFANNPLASKLPNSERWLDVLTFGAQPEMPALSGLALEYRIIALFSRDADKHEATLAFDLGQESQALGLHSELPIVFDCRPARTITFHVKDDLGKPTLGAFVIRDSQGRVYPSQAKRVAPDLAFQPQVYRGDGETVTLPDGTYTVEFSRGPESIHESRALIVTPETREISFQSKRWIDPAAFGWWSGDHHLHAAGCSHYVSPMEGVLPKDMIRYVMGEDLKVGANLTWGPCFDFQKQFFCGSEDPVSRYPYLLHYDIEVSGFGSHRSGHLALLRLKQEIYPGGTSKDHWPTLCLNTLRWAKQQGAVTGFAHSGFGLQVSGTTLPTYEIPPYDGVGANEYIVDVTHQVPGPDGKPVPAIDFMSLVNSPAIWELNMWYHTLNAGFRTRVSGETDFPCIYDTRVGMGRSYVKLDGPLTYDAWCEGIRQGRSYVGDGRSHLMGFAVNGLPVGEKESEVRLDSPAKVHVTARVAALLEAEPDPRLKGIESPQSEAGQISRTYNDAPSWSVERARIGDSREVPVEVIVNGAVVATRAIAADGSQRELSFDIPIATSSWVALRILPSSHTNPIFVLVGDKPIRASRRSVDWCLKGVDQCWSQKYEFIQASELDEAKAAYRHAHETYLRLLTECTVD